MFNSILICWKYTLTSLGKTIALSIKYWLIGNKKTDFLIKNFKLQELEHLKFLLEKELNSQKAYVESEYMINIVNFWVCACSKVHKMASNSAYWLVYGG